ncbi:hypothetical protein MED01_004300 [Micromonospora sp. MED01]|uniref:hypothetical protein n=1 Tax=Micromonospora alfalfae TaxID=2911212 RepID=UPI001EE9414D|nr:hypothetical protein [Micromonospora alfalfae]MCG5460874.1 hypothetical protein [Micromonospora alfalfae]
MQSSNIRRLMLGALFGAAAAVAFSTPAHADDGPQRPGGVLGAVVGVVDEILPEPSADPEPPAESEPVSESSDDQAEQDTPTEQAPVADEPAGDTTPEPTTPPSNPVRDVVDSIKDTVEEVVEVVEVITTPPVVVTPPTTPVTTPAPTPATQPTVDTAPVTDDTTATEPTTDTVVEPAAETAPADLPVVGPVAGSDTLLPGLTPTQAGDTPDRGPQCTSDRGGDTTPDHGRGVVRTITDRRPGLPTAGQRVPSRPCPAPAGPDGQAATVGSPKPPPPTGEQLVALTATGVYSAPVLHRLTHLRARGDLPAGRNPHIEPGPA